ncbi:MAG: NusA-like transcription termination signal-binding factor [Thermoplasmatales archaeon]
MKVGEITLDTRSLDLIKLFEESINLPVKDVMETDDVIFYVLEKGGTYKLFTNDDKKRALEKIKEKVKKRVNVLDYSPDPEQFFRNLFYRYKVMSLNITSGESGYIVNVKVDPNYKASAIGKEAKNLKTALLLARRHFTIARIFIE